MNVSEKLARIEENIKGIRMTVGIVEEEPIENISKEINKINEILNTLVTIEENR